MIPGVPISDNENIKPQIDFKLKPNWRFDAAKRVFTSDSGEQFSLGEDLPEDAKVVYKTPNSARASAAGMSREEKELRQYMQVILPKGESPAEYLKMVRSWPCVAEAHTGPQISLPNQFSR